MLCAVHISNNVLAPSWEWGGFAIAAVLVTLAAWRLHEDEIAPIALLTAAFFVASSIHVQLPGTSVHLILNGLVGIVLGWRSALAIGVGLTLQAILIGHGGYLALGVNTCVMTIPALLAWLLFRGLQSLPWTREPLVRMLLVALSAAVWLISGISAVSLLWFRMTSESPTTADDARHALNSAAELALATVMHPAVLVTTVGLAILAAWIERRLENAPEFPLGLTVGVVTVLLTVAANCGVLILGGQSFGYTPAPLVIAVLHLPVAAIEGVILGFTVGFLAKVRPELLGVRPETPPRAPLPTVPDRG